MFGVEKIEARQRVLYKRFLTQDDGKGRACGGSVNTGKFKTYATVNHSGFMPSGPSPVFTEGRKGGGG